MAEDFIDYYDQNPNAFPTQEKGLVEVPKELRAKFAVYAQSADAVSRLTQDFTADEKQWVQTEREKYHLEINGKMTNHGWAQHKQAENFQKADKYLKRP